MLIYIIKWFAGAAVAAVKATVDMECTFTFFTFFLCFCVATCYCLGEDCFRLSFSHTLFIRWMPNPRHVFSYTYTYCEITNVLKTDGVRLEQRKNNAKIK